MSTSRDLRRILVEVEPYFEALCAPLFRTEDAVLARKNRRLTYEEKEFVGALLKKFGPDKFREYHTLRESFEIPYSSLTGIARAAIELAAAQVVAIRQAELEAMLAKYSAFVEEANKTLPAKARLKVPSLPTQ